MDDLTLINLNKLTPEKKIKFLQKWFIIFSGIKKKHEIIKILSRWIITHKSFEKNNTYFFFPTITCNCNTYSDIQIISELV